MSRFLEFLVQARSMRDRHGLALLLLVAVIAAWLLALPFSEGVQQATIDRFHLTSPSFTVWMLQQPIPPMYNLENRYWYSPRSLNPEELTVPPSADVRSEMVNHFPARMITCASGRLMILEGHRDAWFYLKSKYRQSERITVYKLTPSAGSDHVRMELVPWNP